ncbi:hypothetical protein H5T87_06930 [bacterium]|nr:hypothetical protein [bacterium]
MTTFLLPVIPRGSLPRTPRNLVFVFEGLAMTLPFVIQRLPVREAEESRI